jgi:spoIIIJ-associated protein
MDWIEVTAKSIDEAKELALDRLGVIEDELEYEVLDEPKGGLFGLGRSDARIRARVKPLSREKPIDRRRRRGRGDRPDRGGGGAGRSRSDGNSSSGDKAAAGTGSGTKSSSSRRRGGRGRGSGRSTGAKPASQPAAAVTATADAEEEQVETQPVGAQADHAQEFVNTLVRTMGFSASVRSEVEDDEIWVSIEGDELGVLVGPRGVTLRALEEVARAVTQHFAGGHSARLHLDVAGYQARRREALAEFARKIAGEVIETGTVRSLEPMPSPDRKIVHDTVAELDGVSTSSEGEEPRRRVVIRPE